MSVESVQWLLKTGIKFSDLPELFQEIEEHRERLPTFETTFKHIHKTTFIVSTEKKTIVERRKDEQRFVEAELINQKKVKVELNMTGDAPDTFLALLSLRDSEDVQFRILLFHIDTPSHKQSFNGPKAMLNVLVLPLDLNELEQQLKIAQLILKEKETSFDVDSKFLDMIPEVRQPKIRQNERSQIFSFIPNGLINKAVKLKRSIRNVMKHIVYRHEEITLTIASWSLLLSSRSYANLFLFVCSVWLFWRAMQFILLDLAYDEKTHGSFEALFLNPISTHFYWFDYTLLFRLIRLTSSIATVYSFFVNTKVSLYLYTTTVEIWFVLFESTLMYLQVGYYTYSYASQELIKSSFHHWFYLQLSIMISSSLWTICMSIWLAYTVLMCKAYSEVNIVRAKYKTTPYQRDRLKKKIKKCFKYCFVTCILFIVYMYVSYKLFVSK